MNYSYYRSPIGMLTLTEENNQVTGVHFGKLIYPKQCNHAETPLLSHVRRELWEYFEGRRKTFPDIVLAPNGTPFQKAVWQALNQIPYGETRTYQQIAQAIGKPNAARAVGNACNRNPIAILQPCHRVVGTGGNLTGYAGGLPIKEQLLSLEQSIH